jgi:hypothetical protein
LQGFALGDIEGRKAVLACLAVFLDALETVTSAQRDLSAAAGGEKQPASAAASGEGTPVAAAADAKPVLDRYGATVTDLAARALHCCYGGNWPSRLGGIAALECLVPRLPEAALPRLVPAASKAVFAVLRILPERSNEEQALGSVLQAIVRRCGGDPDAPPVPPPEAPAMQPKAEKEGEADADAERAAADGDTEMKEADAEDDGKPAAGEASPAAAKSDGAAAGGGSPAASGGGIPEAAPLPPLLKTLMEMFVQQLLSSRSSSAVRAVASANVQASAAGAACACRPCHCAATPAGSFCSAVPKACIHALRPPIPPCHPLSSLAWHMCTVTVLLYCLQVIANARGATVPDLLKPVMKAFENILDRRMLPIRSITSQVRAGVGVWWVAGGVGGWGGCMARGPNTQHHRPGGYFLVL